MPWIATTPPCSSVSGSLWTSYPPLAASLQTHSAAPLAALALCICLLGFLNYNSLPRQDARRAYLLITAFAPLVSTLSPALRMSPKQSAQAGSGRITASSCSLRKQAMCPGLHVLQDQLWLGGDTSGFCTPPLTEISTHLKVFFDLMKQTASLTCH